MAVADGGNGKLPEVYPHVTVYDDAGTITLYAVPSRSKSSIVTGSVRGGEDLAFLK